MNIDSVSGSAGKVSAEIKAEKNEQRKNEEASSESSNNDAQVREEARRAEDQTSELTRA